MRTHSRRMKSLRGTTGSWLALVLLLSCIPTFLAGMQDAREMQSPGPFDIPPLQALIDSALVNAPLLERYDVNMELLSASMPLERRRWMDFVFFEGNTRYGVYDQIHIRGVGDSGDSPVGYMDSREQMWYYGGVSLKLPLSAFATQRRRVQQVVLSFDMVSYEKRMAEEEIRKEVIEAYYELLFRQESMHTFYAIYQDLEIAFHDAIYRLREQKISFQDYATLSSTYGKAKNDYARARSDFLISLGIMRVMTGWDF